MFVGNQQIVNVRFIVPDNIPQGADGTFVPVSLEVTTQSGSSPDSILNENTGIDLIIVHS
jgi:hypothetical protein